MYDYFSKQPYFMGIFLLSVRECANDKFSGEEQMYHIADIDQKKKMLKM